MTHFSSSLSRPALIVSASVLVQTLLGSLYAWSVFVPSLRADHGLSTAQTQLVFGTMVLVFVLMMTLAGQVLDRVGSRLLVLLAALLYGGGYVVAALSGGAFWAILLGIGVISGAGVGAGYVAALTACVRWFPDRKGLVTGIAVAGFGGGAVLVSTAGEYLMKQGMGVLDVFFWLGVSCGAVILLLSPLVRLPVSSAPVEMAASAGRPSRHRQFWASCLGMFAGTFAGLLVIGNLVPIGRAGGLEAQATALAVAAFAVGNAAGRLLWGWVFDSGSFGVLPASLATIGLSMLGINLAAHSPVAFAIASLLAGMAFGSCFVLYAAFTVQVFGPARLGRIYPYVFLFYAMAAVLGPPIGGWVFDTTGSYDWAIWLAAGVAGVGALGLNWLGRQPAESGQAVGSGAMG